MPIQTTDWIWMNGTFVPWKEANVHVMSHALHYGSSIFEGLRAYKTVNGTAVFALDGHLDRLWNSCKVFRMSIPYERPVLKDAIVQTVLRNELESAYIRPIVYRGFREISLDARKAPVEVAVITFPFGRYLGPEAIELLDKALSIPGFCLVDHGFQLLILNDEVLSLGDFVTTAFVFRTDRLTGFFINELLAQPIAGGFVDLLEGNALGA